MRLNREADRWIRTVLVAHVAKILELAMLPVVMVPKGASRVVRRAAVGFRTEERWQAQMILSNVPLEGRPLTERRGALDVSGAGEALILGVDSR